MRNVSRSSKPRSLSQNARQWTTELLAEIRRSKQSGRPVPDSYYDKYRKDDVRDALVNMYGGYCCYCEGRIGDVSYYHIEHRKPKREFPRDTFNWENLHLSCVVCNTAKNEKWNKRESILDAVDDVPITDHLTYREGESGVRRWPLSARGTTTVEHAQLDRTSPANLPWRRAEILLETLRVIREIKVAPQSPENRAKRRELVAKTTGEYGSLIAWAMQVNNCR